MQKAISVAPAAINARVAEVKERFMQEPEAAQGDADEP